MICDIVVSWPLSCDYPLWRQYIHDNRQRFNEIIVAFTETNTGEDYREFIKSAMLPDYVHFLNAPIPRAGLDDWRNLAVNAALLHSYNAPWVWFTEQDFYPGEGFWDEVQLLENEGCQVIAAYQGERMHPCCIFMKREALNGIKRNFGIVPDKYDHFYLIQKEIEAKGYNVGKLSEGNYYHYNGLSQNMSLLNSGQIPNYEPEKFADWLKGCLACTVPLDERFVKLAQKMR